jgi:hypothetical protein
MEIHYVEVFADEGLESGGFVVVAGEEGADSEGAKVGGHAGVGGDFGFEEEAVELRIGGGGGEGGGFRVFQRSKAFS